MLRAAAIALTSLAGLYLVSVLAFGSMLLTEDWSALACFDGDEPACAEPDPGPAGLGAVRASSWAMAAVAVLSVGAAFVLALRLRRVVTAVAVLALLALSVGLTQVLSARV